MIVTFRYLDKCASADPHIKIGVLVGGVQRLVLIDNLSTLTAETIDSDDAEATARVLLQTWFRRDKHDYPNATLAQRRARLEAQEWVI